MKFPFTTEEFLDVFKQYNQDVWPAQIAFVLLALLCVYFIIGHKTYKTRIVTSILAFFWLWMGLVYHLLFFATINPAAYLFAGLFMVQGILFFILGVLRKPLSTSHPTINIWAGFVLIAYALLIYPIIGYYAGHGYPLLTHIWTAMSNHHFYFRDYPAHRSEMAHLINDHSSGLVNTESFSSSLPGNV